MGYSLQMCGGPYRIPNLRASGQLVYTNKLRFGAFRGFGNPQVLFPGEQQIDQIGERLGLDPFEFRRGNLLQPGDGWSVGPRIGSNGLERCLDAAQQATRAPRADGRPRQLGLAVSAHISGLPGTGAIVRMLDDGTISLNTGATDFGQGSDTVLAQICAEELRLPLSHVAVASPDTDASPFTWGTTASRVTSTTGRAHLAVGGPIMGSDTLVFDEPTHGPKRAIALGLPFPRIGLCSFAAMAVDVDVDPASDRVSVAEVWSVADVGRAINPPLVEVQLHGGFVQGLGYALHEEMVWDRARLANPPLMDYKVPTARDMPDVIRIGYSIARTGVSPPPPRRRKTPISCGRTGEHGGRHGTAGRRAPADGIRGLRRPVEPRQYRAHP